jgi:hypothetical protein
MKRERGTFVVAIALGLVSLLASASIATNEYRSMKALPEARGVVVESSEKVGEGGSWWTSYTVEWTDRDGEVRRFQGSAEERGPRVGDELSFRYDPANPNAGPRSPSGWTFMSVIFGLVGLLCLTFAYQVRRRVLREERQGRS